MHAQPTEGGCDWRNRTICRWWAAWFDPDQGLHAIATGKSFLSFSTAFPIPLSSPQPFVITWRTLEPITAWCDIYLISPTGRSNTLAGSIYVDFKSCSTQGGDSYLRAQQHHQLQAGQERRNGKAIVLVMRSICLTILIKSTLESLVLPGLRFVVFGPSLNVSQKTTAHQTRQISSLSMTPSVGCDLTSRLSFRSWRIILKKTRMTAHSVHGCSFRNPRKEKIKSRRSGGRNGNKGRRREKIRNV